MAERTTPPDLKPRLKASYDAIAARYNEWTTPHWPTRLHYLDLLVRRLPTTGPVSVLELGCGNGVPVTRALLARPDTSVTANDLSGAQVALAAASLRPNPRLALLEGDMTALELPAAGFDAVVAMYSIIHLPRDEQVRLLRKVVAWLRPGGWVLANFAGEADEGRELRGWLGEEKGWMFWSGWGSEGTLERVAEVGLEVVVQETVGDAVDDATFLWILARKKE